MSRIGQLQEMKALRADVEALKKSLAQVCAGMSDTLNQVSSLRAAIDSLAPIANDVESRRGPGRPRKVSLGERDASRSD
jgi:hypothetical protein